LIQHLHNHDLNNHHCLKALNLEDSNMSGLAFIALNVIDQVLILCKDC